MKPRSTPKSSMFFVGVVRAIILGNLLFVPLLANSSYAAKGGKGTEHGNKGGKSADHRQDAVGGHGEKSQLHRQNGKKTQPSSTPTSTPTSSTTENGEYTMPSDQPAGGAGSAR